jgi:hypothetical protein
MDDQIAAATNVSPLLEGKEGRAGAKLEATSRPAEWASIKLQKLHHVLMTNNEAIIVDTSQEMICIKKINNRHESI